MAQVTLKGNIIHTKGLMPKIDTMASDFTGVKSDLSELTLHSLKGKRVVLSVFPSLDTATCAASVRRFNKEAAALKNTIVLAISKDLPFAHGRFCSTEGIDQVIALSVFRTSSFDDAYGMLLVDGPLQGLLARGIVVIDEMGKVVYTELVSEITHEPNYESALGAIQRL